MSAEFHQGTAMLSILHVLEIQMFVPPNLTNISHMLLGQESDSDFVGGGGWCLGFLLIFYYYFLFQIKSCLLFHIICFCPYKTGHVKIQRQIKAAPL